MAEREVLVASNSYWP